jgi:hypothetical protein
LNAGTLGPIEGSTATDRWQTQRSVVVEITTASANGDVGNNPLTHAQGDIADGIHSAVPFSHSGSADSRPDMQDTADMDETVTAA